MALTSSKDYLIWSIFSLVCCCCPLGLAALIMSIKTRDATHQNDSDSAEKYSRTAFILNIVALVLGILCLIGVVVFYVVTKQHQ